MLHEIESQRHLVTSLRSCNAKREEDGLSPSAISPTWEHICLVLEPPGLCRDKARCWFLSWWLDW